MRLIVVAMCGLLAAAPAIAADTAPVSIAAEQAPAPAKAKKICRVADVNSAGRIGGGRVCKTAEEWAKADDNKKSSGRSVRSLKSD